MSGPASENRLGVGLVVVGAAALAVSVFLPLVEQTGLIPVRDNTLIQHGGWVFLALALGIVGTGYRASQGKQTERWLLVTACALAALLIFKNANDKGLLTLYPIGADGNAITTQPGTVASLGIAIYVAGAGVAAAFIGALTFFQSPGAEAPLAAPAPQRSPGAAKPAARPTPQAKPQRTQAEWEAEVEAAEAEAEAAAARARAIRMRLEARGTAKSQEPAPVQGGAAASSRSAPVANFPVRATDLQVDDQVQILAPGGDYLKVGTVTRILGEDEVEVKLGKMAGTYTYGSDELKVLGRKIHW